MNEEYFTNNMKPYAENINDGLLIADGVDLTVYTKLPQMFNDGRFPNELNNTRQCGVSLVTLIEKEGTVNINNTDVTGSGRVVFKIYPNFNQFHKWNRISWVCETGTLTCSLEKIDGTEILSDIENGASLTEHSELKKLQEINLVLNLENADLTEISLEFVNNTSSSNKVIASINQANVTGLEEDLSSLESDLSSLESDLSSLESDLSSLESDLSSLNSNVTQKISNLNTEVWGSNTQTGNSRIDTLESDVSSLSTSITNTYHWDYQNKQGSGQVTYDHDGVLVNAYRRGNTVTVRIRVNIKYINMGSDNATLSLATLPSGYRPPIQLYSLNAIYPYYTMFRYGSINTNGQINLNVKGATSVQTVNAWIDLAFTYVTTEDAPSQ